MKDKTQKSFRGIVRILLLVFCYTFGSHAFALALEHEQTVDIYKVTDVPNPRNESSSNWVSNPNQILDESYVWEINNMLSQLEDSLSIEVTVVALPSIGEDIPADLYRLFPQADATYIAAPPAKERVRRMRVNFQYADTDYLYVLPVDSVADEPLRGRYNVPQINDEFAETCGLLWRHAQINLLDGSRWGRCAYTLFHYFRTGLSA